MLGRGSREKSREPDASGGADSSLSPGHSSVAVAERAASAENGGDSSRPRLGELLVTRGVATPEQIEEALSQQESGALFGQLLVDMGTISQSELLETLAEQFGVQSIDLNVEELDPEAAAFVPEDFARAHLVVAVSCENKHLRVAVADPSQDLRRNLEKLSGCSVEMFLAPVNILRSAIETQYRALGGVRDLIRAFEAVEGSRRQSAGPEQQEVPGDDAPIVQVVNRILTQALRDRASDVHIEPQAEVVRVRYRIDGTLKEVLELPGAMGLGLISRIKIMAGMNIVERRRPQDGQLAMDIDGKRVDVRVATVATISGEKCVMRILDTSRSVLRLSDLGMPPDTHHNFSELSRAPFGMVLCAGPTGSGKTTTLYATLSELNDPTRNIMTIEDPVEYVFPSINQIQTNEAAGLTFATGLKSILRQDPDVILVGEIRDVETARIAVQSALTGHFVLSSLHATDSVSALHRFLDMGIESFLIASSVLAVVGQRLVRRICPQCKVPYEPTDAELAFYRESEGPDKNTFYHGAGCNFCAGTGYHARIGVYELLKMTPEIKRLIVGWATQEELRRLAQRQGMRTLREETIDLVAHDVTTIEEVIRSIYSL
jgi:type IV pilus assembly protein PilB